MLTNVDDAFGGFTEGLLHDIREEYPKTPILTYGIMSSVQPAREVSDTIRRGDIWY